MFTFFAKKMTHYSGYLLDWSNFAVLARSSTHRYSNEQIIVRGIMATFSAASGLIAAHYNDEERTGCSDITVGLTLAMVALCVAHPIAMIPVITKRYLMKKDANDLIEQIENQFPSDSDQDKLIRQVAKTLGNSTLPNDKAKASQTLGARKRWLTTLRDLLIHSEDLSHFTNKTEGEIVSIFINNDIEELKNPARRHNI